MRALSTNRFVTVPVSLGVVNSTLWLDDGLDSDSHYTPSYATGVSPTLWYRDPVIADIECPGPRDAAGACTAADEALPNATAVAPLDTKNVEVRTSRYGARGMLVVSSVFAQGYTVADVQCADANGTPPCTSQDYDYLDIFSYSAPRDQDKQFVVEGQRIDGFAGGVTEFDGLTEIGFPQTFCHSTACKPNGPLGAADVNKAREPTPVKVCDGNASCGGVNWYANPLLFERNENGLVEIDNAKICNIDADYTTYKQWKIDLSGGGGNCPRSINVISAGVAPFDPKAYANMTIPRIVGVLRPINIGSFNVFIIYPRGMNDITLP